MRAWPAPINGLSLSSGVTYICFGLYILNVLYFSWNRVQVIPRRSGFWFLVLRTHQWVLGGPNDPSTSRTSVFFILNVYICQFRLWLHDGHYLFFLIHRGDVSPSSYTDYPFMSYFIFYFPFVCWIWRFLAMLPLVVPTDPTRGHSNAHTL